MGLPTSAYVKPLPRSAWKVDESGFWPTSLELKEVLEDVVLIKRKLMNAAWAERLDYQGYLEAHWEPVPSQPGVIRWIVTSTGTAGHEPRVATMPSLDRDYLRCQGRVGWVSGILRQLLESLLEENRF